MNWNIEDSLEAIANLLYLARVSLDRKEAAETYLAIAEETVKDAARRASRLPPPL